MGTRPRIKRQKLTDQRLMDKLNELCDTASQAAERYQSIMIGRKQKDEFAKVFNN